VTPPPSPVRRHGPIPRFQVESSRAAAVAGGMLLPMFAESPLTGD
jgi:hypothetical protein